MKRIAVFDTRGFISIEPINKIKTNFYRCDNRFHLDKLLAFNKQEVGKMLIAYINGKTMNLTEIISYTNVFFKTREIDKKSMRLQNNFRKGGQSASRLERIGNSIRKHYISEFEEFIVSESRKNNYDLLVLSGPGTLKTELSRTTNIIKWFEKTGKLKLIAQDKLDLVMINKIYYPALVDLKNTNIVEFQKLIDLCSEKLLFGRDEILTALTSFTIKKLVILESNVKDKIKQAIDNSNAIVIIVPVSAFLDTYSGMIGQKWY